MLIDLKFNRHFAKKNVLVFAISFILLSNGRLSTLQHMKKTRIPAVNAYAHI